MNEIGGEEKTGTAALSEEARCFSRSSFKNMYTKRQDAGAFSVNLLLHTLKPFH